MNLNCVFTILITLLASGGFVHGQSSEVAGRNDEAREIRSNIRDVDGHKDLWLRGLTNDDLVALRRRGWFSDAWGLVKSGVKKVGNKIVSGVKKIGNKINQTYSTSKTFNLKPGETYSHSYEFRDTGSSDAVDRRAFHPYRFPGVPVRSDKRVVTKLVKFPSHGWPWGRRYRQTLNAATEKRGPVVRRSYFTDPARFIVEPGKGNGYGVAYRDLSSLDQSEDK